MGVKGTYTILKASIDADLVRTEEFQGREYRVAPVVAVVEGVMQGVNSTGPEFASADAFEKDFYSWNGRPVVMNHPKSGETFVSANSPDILDTYGMGSIFAAKVEDSKLKLEAWIDVGRVAEQGGDFEDTLARLDSGELVEVSVGAFIEQKAKKGKFKGKAYESVWETVIPDHLALLPKGVKGACSVESGCGSPRINMTTQESESVGEIPTNNTEAPECMPCAIPSMRFEAFRARPDSEDNPISAFEITTTRFNNDIRRAINTALVDYLKVATYDVYMYGYTGKYVVYDIYTPKGIKAYRIDLNVDDSLNVEFTSEPVEVQVIMDVIEKGTNMNIQVNGTAPTQGEVAPEEVTETPADTTTPTTESPTPATEVPSPVPSQPSQPSAAQATQSLDDYINAAPADMQEVLRAGVKQFSDAKAAKIKAIKDTGRCTFTDAKLASMSMEDLDSLAKLSQVPTYEGQAMGDRNTVMTPVESYHAAPTIFDQPDQANVELLRHRRA